MRRVPNRRGYIVMADTFTWFIKYCCIIDVPIPLIPSKIAQYETAENSLVKMRQPHDRPTSSDDERNTD